MIDQWIVWKRNVGIGFYNRLKKCCTYCLVVITPKFMITTLLFLVEPRYFSCGAFTFGDKLGDEGLLNVTHIPLIDCIWIWHIRVISMFFCCWIEWQASNRATWWEVVIVKMLPWTRAGFFWRGEIFMDNLEPTCWWKWSYEVGFIKKNYYSNLTDFEVFFLQSKVANEETSHIMGGGNTTRDNEKFKRLFRTFNKLDK